MVGQLTVTKPSRSDELLDTDQQLKITDEIRAHFESLVPKRPLKPNRSESDSSTLTRVDCTPIDENIPELDKFRALQSRSQITLSADGAPEVQDEYVETQYYRELHSIDKQHHTTGSGFIRVVGAEGEGGHEVLKLQNGQDGAGGVSCIEFRSNPATNDWVPKINQDQVFVSSKPNRSEGS
ncbi:hypothetical protein I3760_Q016800 [Carya illinoinensis]|uniref:Maternal effect embryo arrest 59 n=1 Tax=Carya illinoinensis TaxID=32201 RepID=A0A8T1RH12_CARIL|nr:uncharacterized protein LOC122304833 [Carya illinoinensis]KAG2411258.1 hypothetical protein I3760_Q016800 [Carya illinoinensis]KAG6666136.1 hypothetical protein CIPAW_01G009700 [Carya illinoinensis]KAG6729101.1 hypothetical protein I3842_01G009200 [Carya illinoinensis]